MQLIRGLHPQLKRKGRSGFELLGRDPHAGKALKDALEGLRSVRAGSHRIIYRVAAGKTLEIVTVGPRRTIYEQTLRFVGRDRPR